MPPSVTFFPLSLPISLGNVYSVTTLAVPGGGNPPSVSVLVLEAGVRSTGYVRSHILTFDIDNNCTHEEIPNCPIPLFPDSLDAAHLGDRVCVVCRDSDLSQRRAPEMFSLSLSDRRWETVDTQEVEDSGRMVSYETPVSVFAIDGTCYISMCYEEGYPSAKKAVFLAYHPTQYRWERLTPPSLECMDLYPKCCVVADGVGYILGEENHVSYAPSLSLLPSLGWTKETPLPEALTLDQVSSCCAVPMGRDVLVLHMATGRAIVYRTVTHEWESVDCSLLDPQDRPKTACTIRGSHFLAASARGATASRLFIGTFME
ncbi:hypothetical protein KIPB_002409 [Kipferlia bialata]|uniref:Uncharacterized protein n=1 Tax=Kipferlia bialata TaxID=797122 RepID=A0A9K3GEX9_9EUKA|nr:hypothetical protein KIPB_002409 [Kipferlia bialata]|eukprot:g2409.t1